MSIKKATKTFSLSLSLSPSLVVRAVRMLVCVLYRDCLCVVHWECIQGKEEAVYGAS